MNTITQDMRYRQSLLHFALRHGVSKASGRYNKARSYICFWLKRYDGSMESLDCQSRRPHAHPNQHTEDEIKLLRDMCRSNPEPGRVELWCRLRKRGYQRSLAGMYRVLHKLKLQPKPVKKACKPRSYQQMIFPGERVQIDVKIIPKASKAGVAVQERLVQCMAIDEFSRLRFLKVYNERSAYSSKDFLLSPVTAWTRRKIDIRCIQTDNGFEFTNRLNAFQTGFLTALELAAQTWASSTN